MAAPVLTALSQGQLHQKLPMDFHPERQPYSLLETFGRTISGLGPWIELTEITDPWEKALQDKYRQLILMGFQQGMDPTSPDYMNFKDWGQPLVDTAYVAYFIVRAPNFSKENLTGEVLANTVTALKDTRKMMPPNMNWNLFSAMVEGALAVLGEDYDLLRVLYAIRLLDDWYLGDGVYGDGPVFHWDYYNSYVMQPMAIDLLDLFARENEELKRYQEKMLPRFTRYAEIQERLINEDGSYPIIGRSAIYRSGAFQVLAQAALQKRLPQTVTPPQVRCALSAMLQKMLSAPTLYDDDGWLRPGVYGYQPGLAEGYIATGSLYMATAVFLPLGLPAADPFWSGEDAPWNAKKIWQGQEAPIDHSIS